MLVASTQVPGFSPWTAVILVSAFGADATVTLLRRVARGHGWSVPHRSHVYQRLARSWASHARVTIAYLALNVLLILPAAVVSVVEPSLAPMVAIALFVALSGLAWLLGAGTEN
jgi:Fuc2NAc and GlcNAc transferase